MSAWIKSAFRNRLFVTLLLATLLPLLLCDVVMMRIIITRNERALAEQASAGLARLHEDMDWLLDELESAADCLAANTAVHSALRRGDEESRLLYQVLYQNTGQMREYARFDIYDRFGQCRYSTDNVVAEEQLDPAWGVLYSAGKSRGLVYRSGAEQGLLAARAVRTYDGRVLGYVVMGVEQAGFDRLLGSHIDTGSDLILVDGLWHNIYCSQSSRAEEMVQSLKDRLLAGQALTGERDEYNYCVEPLERDGFCLVLKQPKTYTATVKQSIEVVSLLTGILCLLLCLWTAWALSRYLSKPVHEMDEAMGRVEKGEYDVSIQTDASDEFARLAASFNRMTAEYRQNLARSVQRQKELNETQLRMMQAQLNPHFLYNTLDSIKWMGITNGVPQIGDITTDLAELLRAGISGDKLITLEEELELIERYVDIQSIRFEDSFTCEIDVEERFMHCVLPKLVLQPLVENSIIHGLAGKEDGYIKLWAERDGEDLKLCVWDNGCGIPQEVLDKLNSQDKTLPGGHLGLNNVDRIIRLYYGDSYGITAHTYRGEGSCIELRLPMQIKGTERGTDDAESTCGGR